MPPTPDRPPDRLSDAELDRVQRRAFSTFLHPPNEAGGLFRDRNDGKAPCSIACVGFALSCWPVGVERGWIGRDDAVSRTLRALRFFDRGAPGPEPDDDGHRGFYYHFLDMNPGPTFGRRAWACELSTMDTALLLCGALMAGRYFDRADEQEAEIRRLADVLYGRADWKWAAGRSATLSHGWRPETGLIRHRWSRFDESLLLYVLATGSPTHAVGPEAWAAVQATHRLITLYDLEVLYAGPLFIHQFPHCWVDFRGIRDDFMRAAGGGLDYFENGRRSTLLQKRYAAEHTESCPDGFVGYGPDAWGFSACEGPGDRTRQIDGRRIRFKGYKARGVPFGPNDGTICPWAAAASYPFAPAEVAAAVRHAEASYPDVPDGVGWRPTVNPSWRCEDAPGYWVSHDSTALDDGPIVLMLENARTGLPWRLMRGCPHVAGGLRRMGFDGGWLSGTT